MIIAISGAGGFIGKQLSNYFKAKGNEVQNIPRVNIDTQAADIANLLQGVEVVINLAGAPIVVRWTKAYKKILLDSRIITTSKIVEGIGLLGKKPGLLISASAVGIYSQAGEQTESDYTKADDYLGEICSAWEAEASKAIPYTRLAIVRFGIVLGKGGVLERMLPLFSLGLGGKIASGKQGFSWIHIYDVCQAVEFIIQNKKLSGEFSFTAPEVVDNKQFTKILAKVLRRPALFTVPEFALKLVFGEGAIAVTGGQFAPPKHLLNEGFQYKFPELDKALEEII